MDIIIKINTDNAAFEDSEIDNCNYITDQIGSYLIMKHSSKKKIMDINGNTVGSIQTK